MTGGAQSTPVNPSQCRRQGDFPNPQKGVRVVAIGLLRVGRAQEDVFWGVLI